MGKLTKAQKAALAAIQRESLHSVRFSTGEVLRRNGFVTRSTEFLVGRDYADADGVHEQWRRDEPIAFHEWRITEAGRLALKEPTP